MRCPPARVPMAVAAALLLTAGLGGCGGTALFTPNGGVRIVAAENFWGSIAAQIGGAHAQTASIIANPAQDPHSYEPTTGDARALATAQLAIVNGVGYDSWAPKLLAANPVDGRITLSVGRLLGLHDGDNPHRWYDPLDVERVAAAIAADLQRLDPAHADYFARQLAGFDRHGLAAYHAIIARIRGRYAGTPVGASESLFALQAPFLGLRLITPPGFMKAIGEGTEVTAQDTAAAEHQIAHHEIDVWIYNAQNVTPEIERLNGMARAAHIPAVRVTETPAPADASFQRWQVAQLRRLAAALAEATGR